MPPNKHIHKLKRKTYSSGNQIYFCVSDCNFKVEVGLSLGKTTICWRCNQIFTITEYTLRLAKPHCGNCHRTNSPSNKTKLEVMSNESLKTENLRQRLNNLLGSTTQVLTEELKENDEDIEL